MSCKLAFLILAHTDLNHLKRLSIRLSKFADVFIHIDINTNQEELKLSLSEFNNIYFIDKRLHCEWGGFNAVVSTINLMKMALKTDNYDRMIFLQGLDYPLKSNDYILDFFEKNKNVEFIRGCNCSISKDEYFYSKSRYILFFNNYNFIKKIWNYVIRKLKLKLKSGFITDDKIIYQVYWGSAQWALTKECVQYIVEFYDKHFKFNKWFKYSFPADEMYFATVVMNSNFKQFTKAGGPEPEKRGLVNWRNLHYFEYPGKIRVFNDNDFEFLSKREELFVRKVNTEESTKLLDLLDSIK